jgi:hypothetical protein
MAQPPDASGPTVKRRREAMFLAAGNCAESRRRADGRRLLARRAPCYLPSAIGAALIASLVHLSGASLAMTDDAKRYSGGCLCGALRYEAVAEPMSQGHCYCADCRKASGSGFVPFMNFRSVDLRFRGEARQFRSRAWNGGEAVRNCCPICMSLVFGGEIGQSDSFTIYAGSLDDPSRFRPTVAIFAEGRPAWALIPPGLTVFDRMPAAHE